MTRGYNANDVVRVPVLSACEFFRNNPSEDVFEWTLPGITDFSYRPSRKAAVTRKWYETARENVARCDHSLETDPACNCIPYRFTKAEIVAAELLCARCAKRKGDDIHYAPDARIVAHRFEVRS